MSLKDNFNQAIREVLHREVLDKNDPPKNTETEALQKAVLSEPEPEALTPESHSAEHARRSPLVNDEPPMTQAPRRTADPIDDFMDSFSNRSSDPLQDFYSREQSYGRGRQGGGYGSPSSGYPQSGAGLRGGRPPENPHYETEETTIISRNTRINGDINSFANVNVEGSVQGDIKLTKNISVSGKVVGNIECNNAVMSGAQMQGCISSKGQVQMDHDSVLLGDIDTQYLDLTGRIKGKVDVGGKAEFKNDAVMVGDIT
ncbi:MAG: polymer-forming cytoskeletal protein, partial [Huintestinicola sp.]